MLLDGRPILPLGHVVHVHNKSASQSVTVSVNATPGGGAFSSKVIAAHQTCSFLLVGYHASRAGIWRIVATDHAHASGPTSPDGFRIEITLQEPRNNVNLLEEAIALGYDGSQPAMVIVHVTEFAHLGSTSNLFPSLSTGGDAAIGGINWFAGSTVHAERGDDSGHGRPRWHCWHRRHRQRDRIVPDRRGWRARTARGDRHLHHQPR